MEGKKIIHFNRPLVPDIEDLQPYLDRILSSRVLTNSGPIHDEFEEALCKYLGVSYISLFSSGTLALALALKALDLKGEVITTPFTSVATIQAIYWNNLVPVFVDIDIADLNISMAAIEKAITPETCAILPVHIFGNPCNVGQIQKIADKYNLKVVYDAAHCFGVSLNGETICSQGDLSVLSFHATKVFNTIEGGAVISHDEGTKKYLDALKNTGLNGCCQLVGYGLNAKMNEFQSAFGLTLLKYLDDAVQNRKAAVNLYRNELSHVKGLVVLKEMEDVEYNYAYFPILVNKEEYGMSRDQLAEILMDHGIITKQYFHPLMCDFPVYNRYKRNPLPVAEQVASEILCLPLYHDIEEQDIRIVVNRVSNPRVGNP
jgi:dTDP-4-amino-4,6-dideoxygalactose transaminase